MWPGFDPRLGVQFVGSFYSAPRGFSADTLVFPSSQKKMFDLMDEETICNLKFPRIQTFRVY